MSFQTENCVLAEIRESACSLLLQSSLARVPILFRPAKRRRKIRNKSASNKRRNSKAHFQKGNRFFLWPVLSFNKSLEDQLPLSSFFRSGNDLPGHEELISANSLANHSNQISHNQISYFGKKPYCFARGFLKGANFMFSNKRLQVLVRNEKHFMQNTEPNWQSLIQNNNVFKQGSFQLSLSQKQVPKLLLRAVKDFVLWSENKHCWLRNSNDWNCERFCSMRKYLRVCLYPGLNTNIHNSIWFFIRAGLSFLLRLCKQNGAFFFRKTFGFVWLQRSWWKDLDLGQAGKEACVSDLFSRKLLLQVVLTRELLLDRNHLSEAKGWQPN